MTRSSNDIFDRLGGDGLSRVLDDLLDAARLTRLANSCGLKYPGMRTQSQKRPRILGDLVRLAAEQQTARRTILRVLQKETQAASRKWNALSDEDRNRLLEDEDFLLSKGNLGLHLFLVAKADGDGGPNGLKRLIKRTPRSGESSPPAETTPRQQLKLEKKLEELQKKVRRLEDQLLQSREDHRASKRDLIKRKGELAESRMLAERQQRELATAQGKLRDFSVDRQTDATDASIDKITRAVRKLGAEQKKLAHELAKATRQEQSASQPDPALGPQLTQVARDLQRELARVKRERKSEVPELSERFAALHTELVALRKAVVKPTRRKRAKGESARVGVFVDVQNVYYGARRLKGKLDFDALLEAAVGGRRLILAAAYVVESKEIDQTGFINVLQQRAIEVRRKTLRVRADGSMKGDWDMELALEILEAAPHLDVVVLVSGDGDFTSLVKRVKRMGPRVEVIGFPRHTAKSLLEAADDFRPLDRKFMIRTDTSASSATSSRTAAGQPKTSERPPKTLSRPQAPTKPTLPSEPSSR